MTPYAKRIKKVQQALKKEHAGASLLLSSAPECSRSRDEEYPYRQNTDFYYLTGSTRTELALLITTRLDRAVLFAIKDDKKQILWQGKREDPEEIANRIGAELVYCEDLYAEILSGIHGVDLLFYQNIQGSVAWQVAKRLLSQPSWERGPLPRRFHHSDVILEPLRLIKDRSELKAISDAIDITAVALEDTIPYMQAGNTEAEIAKILDFNMNRRAATQAFKSIVAAGKSASVLHYTAFNAKLKEHELLMIDSGAEYNMYCGDITRTFPIGGKFEGVLKDVYLAVLAAQKATIKVIKPGVKMRKLQLTAVKTLIEGLKSLKVLRGDTDSIIKKRGYLPYFPHSIGHSLGLDVHDLGRYLADTTLEEGMVITVEPGLYFPKKVAQIPSCGIRIEDDVVVTKTGAKILGTPIPKEIDDLEEWMR